MSDGINASKFTDKKTARSKLSRIARMFTFIGKCDLKEGVTRSNLLLRSSMMNSTLTNGFSSRLEIEAGTLSFLPIYCDFKSKALSRNFGQDVKNLVQEVYEIQKEFWNEEPDETIILGKSFMAKNIFMYQCYIDMVMAFNTTKSVVVDGWFHKAVKKKGKKYYLDVDGELMPVHQFHQHIVDIAHYKMDVITMEGIGVRQALREFFAEYRKQQGYDFGVVEGELIKGTDES